MSILVRWPPSNLSKQDYESLRGRLEQAGDWPADGCQLHVVFGPESDVRASEVWESMEKFEAFAEKLQQTLEEAGIALGDEPEIFEDVHRVETY
jgi:cytochrome c556